MKQLRMKTPDYLPRASENVEAAVEMIERLLRKGAPTDTGETSTSIR